MGTRMLLMYPTVALEFMRSASSDLRGPQLRPASHRRIMMLLSSSMLRSLLMACPLRARLRIGALIFADSCVGQARP